MKNVEMASPSKPNSPVVLIIAVAALLLSICVLVAVLATRAARAGGETQPPAEAASSGVSLPTPRPDSAFLTAAGDSEVRANPEPEAEVLGILKANQRAEIVGASEDGLWWAILIYGLPEDRGWISDADVAAENAASVPVLPAP